MSLHHASSGELIDIRPMGPQLENAPSIALVRTDDFGVMRLVLREGKSTPQHHVPGEITLQCLEGTVEVQVSDKTLVLQSGQMVFLEGNTPYALCALENASLLMTMLRKGE